MAGIAPWGMEEVSRVSLLSFQKLPHCVGCSLLTFTTVTGWSGGAEGLDVFVVMVTPLHTTFWLDDNRVFSPQFQTQRSLWTLSLWAPS